jgi:hypothetical protein
MSKRALFLLLIFVVLNVFPAAAQSETSQPADFVPVNMAGFVQLQIDDSTIQDLNITAFVASRLQPNRIDTGGQGVTLDGMVSLETLFDMSNASFEDHVLPWLGDAMVIAYRDFDGQFAVAADDALLIFPTTDILESASALSEIIEAQDLLERQVYRGITVYIGDQTTIAITALAVFVGPTDLVEAALDVQAGVSDAMTDSPVYHALRDAINADSRVFAYVDGNHILPAVSGLMSGSATAQPLLAAFGGAVGHLRGEDRFESLLLNNGFDGAAAGLEVATEGEQIFVTATAVFHAISAPSDMTVSETYTELLDMIPQNALLVGNGADAQGLVYDVITALPLSNFAREVFGGLPIQTVGTASDQITVPDAAQVENAVSGYLTMMERFKDFNLQTDLVDYLAGDYVVALLPRPNDPLPVLNIPFDLLVVARVNDEEAALAGAGTLLQTMLNLESLETESVNNWDFNRLGIDGQPILSLGARDGLLIIATGNTAARTLASQRGDNRLTSQDAWGVLSESRSPDVYLDSFVFLNTFFPSPGGAVASNNDRVHFGLYSDYLGQGLYQLKLVGVVPSG